MADSGGRQGRQQSNDGDAAPATYGNFRDRPVDALWSAHRRLGDAVRELLDGLIGLELSENELLEMAEGFERRARELAARPHLGLLEAFDRVQRGGSDAELADVVWRLDYGPSLGFCNPVAAPIRTWQSERGTDGAVRFGPRYEGPPGCVNGGFVAAALDEILGLSAAHSGMQAMTGRLEVSFRRPTPLERELSLRGELVGVEGRKITTRARLLDEDELLAEARGLFIAVRVGGAEPG